MKKLRLHIYLLIGVFVITFIVGSFVDEGLNAALFSRNNTFGLTMSAIGTIPGYGVFAILGGGAFAFFMNKNYKMTLRIFCLLFSILGVALGVHFSGREIFSANGFYQGPEFKWTLYGYLILLPVMLALAFLGYILGKKSDNPNLWIVYVVLSIAIFFSLIPGVSALKSIFHRPRYRLLDLTGLEFYPWWKPCKNYKELLETFAPLGVTKEEFKSFPSGHAGATAVSMMFAMALPFVNRKYMKYQMPIFYGAFAWTLLVMFTRMLVGAHFLSDVSIGILLTLIFMMIANEFMIHFKKIQEYKLIEPQEVEQGE